MEGAFCDGRANAVCDPAQDGEAMASLCREFGISRKTGYKIFERYEQCGLEGLSDRTRRPSARPSSYSSRWSWLSCGPRGEKPPWGARKIPERLLRACRTATKIPAAATIQAVLDRHGLVKAIDRRRNRAERTPLSDGLHFNDLRCTDLQGELHLNDKRYGYPLIVTDYCSLYLLLCEALKPNREELAFPAYERLF